MKTATILLLAATCLLSCKDKKKEAPQKGFALSDKMLSTTTTTPATVSPVKNEIKFYGKITADNNKYIEVYPVVGGNVTKVYVELGDYVQKGQLLATIRSTEVAGFEKDLDDAKTSVVTAANNLKVARQLYEGKLSTEREVVQAQSELDKANAQLKRAQETFNVYNIKRGAIYEVRAPLSGFVIEKKINQNMLLRNDRSDNIFDIAQINQVWAIANVNESDIDEVKIGENAEVTTLSYPDKKFYGKVDKIYSIIDPETKAMKARITLQNVDFLLKPEMRATIKVSYVDDRSMIAVPAQAIIFDKSKNFVMVFKSNHNIETRQIEVFKQVGDMTYISSGIEKGEKIITTNQLLIYDALND